MANPLAERAGKLLLLKKELLADPEREEQLIAKARDIFQTSFSMKVPFRNEDTDETAVREGVSQGIQSLTYLYGFSEISDEASHLLQSHFSSVLGRLLTHYEKSQHRREEGLQTAFKSSLQHALFASNITHPDQLQTHMVSRLRVPAQKIANWWDKYLNSSTEDRAAIIKNELRAFGENKEPSPAHVPVKKTARKRKAQESDEDEPSLPKEMSKRKPAKKTKKIAKKVVKKEHDEGLIEDDGKKDVKTEINEGALDAFVAAKKA